MSKISVVIPVYNSEKYLRDCLESVKKQTFEDFEVLLINDGSTDSSGKICDDYAKKDSRIKVFHKKNEGVSIARNVGIENAKSEWICFVDSDDYILPNYLQDLFSYTNLDYDLVVHGFVKKEKKDTYFDLGELILTKEELSNPELFENHKILNFGYTVSKLYRNSILKENGLTFPNKSSHGEDLIFFLQYLPLSKKIIFVPTYNYVYNIVDDSLVRKIQEYYVYHNQYELLKNVFHQRYYGIFKSVFSEKSNYLNVEQAFLSMLLKSIKVIYKNQNSRNERKEFLKKLNKEDLIFLEKKIEEIKNPALKIGFKLLINQNIFMTDLFFITYYKLIKISKI